MQIRNGLSKERLINELLSLYPSPPYSPSQALWRTIEALLILRAPLNNPMLDLGCGSGAFSSTLFHRIAVGLDLSKDNLKEANKRGVYDSLVVADATKMPFRNGCFQSVLSNSTMEHIPDCDKVLDETCRVLKKDGTFTFTVPNNHFSDLLFLPQILRPFRKFKMTKKAIKWYASQRNSSLFHFHLHSSMEWRDKLKLAGLKPLEIRCYLTPLTLFVWDFICVVSNKLKFSLVLRLIPKQILARVFKVFCNAKTGSGGALIIVAEKQIPTQGSHLN